MSIKAKICSVQVRALAVFTIVFGLLAVPAQAAQLKKVDVFNQDGHLQIGMQLQGKPDVRYFSLQNPDRFVVDLKRTDKVRKLPLNNHFIRGVKKIRTGWPKPKTLRVVFEVTKAVPLKPKWTEMGQGAYRLDWLSESVITTGAPMVKRKAKPKQKPVVIPVKSKPKPQLKATDTLTAKFKTQLANLPKLQPASAPRKYIQSKKTAKARPVVVAIDAGHGGNDSGAIGPMGTFEKRVTLQVALQLKRLLKLDPMFKPIMVRSSDRYLKLRKRTSTAKNYNADIFVSLHADAFTSPKVRGASVYALSLRGASSEHARVLAKKQNAVDLIGGVSLYDKADHLASVLLDLTQTATLEDSLSAGNLVLGELSKVTKLHKKRVHQAGFMVLKSPDIPSLLIELGYISSPDDELLLTTKSHQRRLARAIHTGLKKYFNANPPAGSKEQIVAAVSRKHKVQKGDTLSQVAENYGVSTMAVKSANRMKTDTLRLGQVLQIP